MIYEKPKVIAKAGKAGSHSSSCSSYGDECRMH
jgi:hypothetical protein